MLRERPDPRRSFAFRASWMTLLALSAVMAILGLWVISAPVDFPLTVALTSALFFAGAVVGLGAFYAASAVLSTAAMLIADRMLASA